MVIERHPHTLNEGQIGGDIAAGDFNHPILHIFGVDELDLVDQLQLFQDSGANEAIEIATGY